MFFYLFLLFSTPTILYSDIICQDSLSYNKKIESVLNEFNIKKPIKDNVYYELCNPVIIGKDIYDRDQKLDSLAAEAFFKMNKDAKKDSIELIIIINFGNIFVFF